MSASITTAKRYVKLAEEKAALDGKLKQVKAEMTDMEEKLIDYFQRHSLRNLGAGGHTVYLHRQIWASLPDKAAAHEALIRHGFNDLVEDKVMPQRLSAWVRELMAESEANEGETAPSSENLNELLPLPDDLKALIKVTEKFSVRVRKA
jgi:hypothetical protein